MDLKAETQAALHDFLIKRTTVQVLVAKVISVDISTETCDVEDLLGHEYYNVRLRAQEVSEGLLIVPKVNSNILMGSIGNSDVEHFVISHSEISSFKVTVGNTQYEVDNQGFAIQKGGENLKAIISDLITAITTLTVTCTAPTTPSSPPLNVAAFTLIKNRLNNLFK